MRSLEREIRTEDVFSDFVGMRFGASASSDSGAPAHIFWHCTGELREPSGGQVFAKVEGFDVSVAAQCSEDKAVQLSRKIFFFLDPDTGEVMTEYQGKPVKPIMYDYQVIEYSRGQNGSIVPSLEQGHGEQRRFVPLLPITSQVVSPGYRLFQAPVFIDVEIPGRGHYQAWEIYDFLSSSSGAQPAHLTWVRQGASPPFSDEASGTVMHLVGTRVESFEELPSSMRDLIMADREGIDYTLFCVPPADFEEISRLQC